MTGNRAKVNSLQAILDRQNREVVNAPEDGDVDRRGGTDTRRAKFRRKNTVLIGGHFPPSVAKQLGILAAEEGVTKQELLREALGLLFLKKGKRQIEDISL